MRDVASGSVLVVVACAYFLGARGLPSGPSFFPHLLSAALLTFALAIIVRGARERPGGERAALMRPAALIVLTVIYALVFAPAGFLISTAGYTAAVVLLLGQGGWRLLLVPVAMTALLYGAFVVGLGVALP